MEYFIRIPVSSLTWFENGELVKNPDFSNNMEVFRVGINENYKDIQKLQEDITTLAPIESVSGEAQARREADILLGKRIDDLIASLPTKLSQFDNDTGFTTKTYVDAINSAIQGQLSSLSNNVAGALVPANIVAGSRVVASVSGNNVTISVDVSDIESSLTKKLEVGNIKAGKNIKLTKSGNDVTVEAEGETISVTDTGTIDMTKSGTTISADVKISGVEGNTLKENPDGLYCAGGGGSSEAMMVSILDEGGYFLGSSVEAALQELGMQLSGLNTAISAQSEVVL